MPTRPPSQAPVQTFLVAPSMPPPQSPVQAPAPASTTQAPWLPAQQLPSVAPGLGVATDRVQAASEEPREMHVPLGSEALGLTTPADVDGRGCTDGADLASADSQLLQVLSAEGPGSAQVRDQDTDNVAPDPAPLDLTGQDSALLNVFSASANGPGPVQAPNSHPESAQTPQQSLMQAPLHFPEAQPPAPEQSPQHAQARRHAYVPSPHTFPMSHDAQPPAPEDNYARASHARRTLQVKKSHFPPSSSVHSPDVP